MTKPDLLAACVISALAAGFALADAGTARAGVDSGPVEIGQPVTAPSAEFLIAADHGDSGESHSMKMDGKASVQVGDLEIVAPLVRATPPNAPVSGGYLTISNHGSEPDRLIGGSAEFAARVEIHEMKMDGDVMQMRELENGLEIPAGGEVVLEPGGFHLMFMELGEMLKPGDKRKVTLEFEKAGAVELEFGVVNPAQMKMKKGGMDNSGSGASH